MPRIIIKDSEIPFVAPDEFNSLTSVDHEIPGGFSGNPSVLIEVPETSCDDAFHERTMTVTSTDSL